MVDFPPTTLTLYPIIRLYLGVIGAGVSWFLELVFQPPLRHLWVDFMAIKTPRCTARHLRSVCLRVTSNVPPNGFTFPRASIRPEMAVEVRAYSEVYHFCTASYWRAFFLDIFLFQYSMYCKISSSFQFSNSMYCNFYTFFLFNYSTYCKECSAFLVLVQYFLQIFHANCSHTEFWAADLNVRTIFCVSILVLPAFFPTKNFILRLFNGACFLWVRTNLIELYINFILWFNALIYLTSSCKIETAHSTMYIIMRLIQLMIQVLRLGWWHVSHTSPKWITPWSTYSSI